MKVIFAFAACLFFASAFFARSEAREIAGAVTDETNKYVVGVTVKLINRETKKTYRTRTNKSGFYSFRNLPFGNYTLRFEGKKEFEIKTIEKLELGMNGGIMYNITLEAKKKSVAKTAQLSRRLNITLPISLTYEKTTQIAQQMPQLRAA